MITIFVILYIIMCAAISTQRTLEIFDLGDSWGPSLLIHFVWGAVLAPIYGIMLMVEKLSDYSFEELMNPYSDPFDVDYKEINKNGNKEKTDESV
jgi:hypothetical protein